MAMHCDHCGERSNEVKAGGEISPQGSTITLTVNSIEDLNRDVLKSDFATISIPEIKLESATGVGEDTFTTVEGLLSIMKQKFLKDNPFVQGDSSDSAARKKMTMFMHDLDQVC